MTDKEWEQGQEPVRVSYIKIVKETDDSWLLEVERNWGSWFPKSHCKLEGLHVVMPLWLIGCKQGEELKYLKNNNKITPKIWS